MGMSFEDMRYGPIGDAVAAALPYTEGDPIGVYASVLSLYSAALSGSVVWGHGRPVIIWTVLAGRSSDGGKGTSLRTARQIIDPSIGGFLKSRVKSGISSGPSLVHALWQFQTETEGSETGVDTRVMVIEDEWSEVLKRARRDPTFHPKLRKVWDGAPVSNITKEAAEEIESPCLGFTAHITPAEWQTYIATKDALGGSFNRLLPVLVSASKYLPIDAKIDIRESTALTSAYNWARQKPRVMVFNKDAGARYDELRLVVRDKAAALPENVSCFMARSAEQVARIAAVLTVAGKRTRITKSAVNAAWSFVSYSIESVEKLVTQEPLKPGRVAKPLDVKIREILNKYAGECSTTLLLRNLGIRVTGESLRVALESMPDVETYKGEHAGRGAPPIMYRLVTPAPVPEPTPAPTVPAPRKSTARKKPAKKA